MHLKKLSSKRARKALLSIMLTSFALFPILSLAHPHNWINVKTQMFVNADNQLIEIQQSWEFDAIYSMITAASLESSYDNQEEAYKEMAEIMRKNLASHAYFSNLIVDGKNIDIPTAESASLVIEKQPPISVMTLDFTIRFNNPINIADKKVVWSVYDPTYYIAMSHREVEDISIIGGNGMECGKELVLPKPTEETVAYASSLDQFQRDTDGLGDQFAERAVLQCI